MQLSEELIKSMLGTLDEHPHNFMLVSDLAKAVGHWTQECALTDVFTNHLLHLQDLFCFVNSEGMNLKFWA